MKSCRHKSSLCLHRGRVGKFLYAYVTFHEIEMSTITIGVARTAGFIGVARAPGFMGVARAPCSIGVARTPVISQEILQISVKALEILKLFLKQPFGRIDPGYILKYL